MTDTYKAAFAHAAHFFNPMLGPRHRHRRSCRKSSPFLSKQKYLQFCMGHMGIFTGNDNQVSAVAAILRDTAMKNNKVVYIIHREGLDLVQRPEAKEKILDFVWVSTKEVEEGNAEGLLGGVFVTEKGVLRRSDGGAGKAFLGAARTNFPRAASLSLSGGQRTGPRGPLVYSLLSENYLSHLTSGKGDALH